MTRLAPNLFVRRYDDLLALGRAQLPALAPEWTDYNAHDPGITLMELLAWVAEAQLYSLGHTSRAERLAYAALLGVGPGGRRAASGLLWPDRSDPSSPAASFAGSRVIDTDATARLEQHDQPVLRAARKVLWIPGRIVGLASRRTDRTVVDLTASNDRGAPFLPFGPNAGPRDVLTMDFETRGDDGLFPTNRIEATGASLIIGVRTPDADAGRSEGGAPTPTHADHLEVTLVAGADRFTLPVEEDTTAGLLRTGILALDVSKVEGSPQSFRIEIRAPRGFVRPPQWLRVEPNVLPITEREPITREHRTADGTPDFAVDLQRAGLCFEPCAEPVRVEVGTSREVREWTRCDRLDEHGPDDRVFELDPQRGRVLFGNGVNGRKPSAGDDVYLSYDVCSGTDGNVARDRTWIVLGFPGVFGVNPDPITGGGERTDWNDLRREARRRAADDHPLVSAADIEAAALALPLLDVARVWVVAARPTAPRTGTVTLVALRKRRGTDQGAPETARWLGAVRRRLAGRMPLGTRLVVAAPRYVPVSIRATVEVEAGRDPEVVREAVRRALEARLSPLQAGPLPTRRPGIPVTRPDVAAGILGVAGVTRVTDLALLAGRGAQEEIRVPPDGLPRLEATDITAAPPAARART